VTTKGSRVKIDDTGVFGVVVEPMKRYGPGKKGMALVEHEMEGQTVQRWYSGTKLTPAKPSKVVPEFPKKQPPPKEKPPIKEKPEKEIAESEHYRKEYLRQGLANIKQYKKAIVPGSRYSGDFASDAINIAISNIGKLEKLGHFKEAKKLRDSVIKAGIEEAYIKEQLPSTQKPPTKKPQPTGKEPWEMSASLYQIKKGVEQPHIGEIAPSQYARLSKRQKKVYDEKRRKEWDASMAVKQEWKEKVIEAYDKGVITPETKGIHEDAKSLIQKTFYEREGIKAKEKERAEDRAREIRDTSEVKVGDELETTLYGKLKVARVNKKSITFDTPHGKVRVPVYPGGEGPTTMRWPKGAKPKEKPAEISKPQIVITPEQAAEEYIRRNPDEGAWGRSVVEKYSKHISRMAKRLKPDEWKTIDQLTPKNREGEKDFRASNSQVGFLREIGYAKIAWDIDGNPYYARADALVLKGLYTKLADVPETPSAKTTISLKSLSMDELRVEIRRRSAAYEGASFVSRDKLKREYQTAQEEMNSRLRAQKEEKRPPTEPIKWEKPEKKVVGKTGNKTNVFIATERGTPEEIASSYKLVEASDVIQSHDPVTFQRNAQYPKGIQERRYEADKSEQEKVIISTKNFKPEFVINTNPDAVNGPPVITDAGVVLGGNSRAMIMKRVYSEGRGEQIKKYLKQNAERFGIPKEDIDKMKQPLLVREIPHPESRERATAIVSKFNEAFTQELRTVESAVSRAKKITPESIDRLGEILDEGETLNAVFASHKSKDFVNSIIKSGLIDRRSFNKYINSNTGLLSEEGKSFVSKSLLGKVIPDAEVLDATPGAFRVKVEKAIPALLKAQTAGKDFNLIPEIVEAARASAMMRSSGFKVPSEWLSQEGLFGKPAIEEYPRALAIWKFIEGHKPGEVKRAFTTYAERAATYKTGQGALSFFEQVTPQSALADAGIVIEQVTRRASGGPAGGQAMAAAGAGKGYGPVSIKASEARGSRPKQRPSIHRVAQEVSPGYVRNAFDALLQGVAPPRRGEVAKRGHAIIVKHLAARAQKGEAARKTLNDASRSFWLVPREETLDFIYRMEAGKPQKTDRLNRIAKTVRGILDQRRDQVRALGKGQLERFYQDYFPHMWKDPERARGIIGRILGSRPLAGPKSFLKKRSIMTVKEGIDAGLEPVSENPIDMVLWKTLEMDRYITSQRLIADLKDHGLIKFVYARGRPPDGYVRIDDSTFKVFLPPDATIGIKEAYDYHLVDNLMSVARSLGVDTHRVMKIRRKAWGYAEGADRVVTKFAGPEDVFIHEIGHILGNRYKLYETLRRKGEGQYKTITRGPNKGQQKWVPDKNAVEHRKEIDEEWRALADLRYEKVKVKPSYQRYVRKEAEKEAVLLQALLHAPKMMEKVAPKLTKLFKGFLNDHSELRPLIDIEPSLVLGSGEGGLKIPGLTKLGDYCAPEPVARLLNNYLSPGLRGNQNTLVRGGYNIVRKLGNALIQAEHALSFFHGINVMFDTVGSQIGLAMKQITTRGQRGKAPLSILRAPVAPIEAIRTGGKIRKAMEQDIDRIADPKMKEAVQAVILAGGRSRMDPMYHNMALRSLRNSIRQMVRGQPREKAKGAVKLPGNLAMGGLEVLSKPVMEWLVPRLKLGVYHKLAQHEIQRASAEGAGPQDLHHRLVRTWESVDNRMGLLVYDNLFWNKTIKDASMLAIRSVGWNLGFFREWGGAGLDVLTAPTRFRNREKILTHKMAYVAGVTLSYAVVGAMIQHMLTGKRPEEMKDYFFPKTGEKNPDGSDERVQLPIYMRDVYSWSDQPIQSVRNKMNPVWPLVGDMVKNEDFFNVQVRDPEDPIVKQFRDTLKHTGEYFLPISVQMYRKLAGEGKGQWPRFLVSLTGIRPATTYIARSPAHKLMMQYIIERIPRATRTKDQQEYSRFRKKVLNKMRSGLKLTNEEQLTMMTEFTPRQLVRTLKDAEFDPMASTYRRLTLEEAMNVYAISNSKERKTFAPILMEKFANTDDPLKEQKEMYEALNIKGGKKK
jgi:hypothetical protein